MSSYRPATTAVVLFVSLALTATVTRVVAQENNGPPTPAIGLVEQMQILEAKVADLESRLKRTEARTKVEVGNDGSNWMQIGGKLITFGSVRAVNPAGGPKHVKSVKIPIDRRYKKITLFSVAPLANDDGKLLMPYKYSPSNFRTRVPKSIAVSLNEVINPGGSDARSVPVDCEWLVVGEVKQAESKESN